jgi:transcriptional repressor NrdR
MRCPFCNADKESLKVIDSRTCDEGKAIRRRRQCLVCKKRFTTYERVEQTTRLVVVKKDGQRKPWDKNKIIDGLERACYKRPVPKSEILRIADEVEDEVFARYDREVPTTAVGELVTDKLRRVDQVAYVRFASVYRRFKTLEELMDEARAVLDAKRFEDPSQGQLFVDAAAQAAAAAAAAAKTNGAEPRNGNESTAGGGSEAAAPRRRGRQRRSAVPAAAPEGSHLGDAFVGTDGASAPWTVPPDVSESKS